MIHRPTETSTRSGNWILAIIGKTLIAALTIAALFTGIACYFIFEGNKIVLPATMNAPPPG